MNVVETTRQQVIEHARKMAKEYLDEFGHDPQVGDWDQQAFEACDLVDDSEETYSEYWNLFLKEFHAIINGEE